MKNADDMEKTIAHRFSIVFFRTFSVFRGLGIEQ